MGSLLREGGTSTPQAQPPEVGLRVGVKVPLVTISMLRKDSRASGGPGEATVPNVPPPHSLAKWAGSHVPSEGPCL